MAHSPETNSWSKVDAASDWSWGILTRTLTKLLPCILLFNLHHVLTAQCSDAQSCLTLFNPMGCRLPGSSVQGILLARILEWCAISSSRGSSRPGIEPKFLTSHTAGRSFTITLWVDPTTSLISQVSKLKHRISNFSSGIVQGFFFFCLPLKRAAGHLCTCQVQEVSFNHNNIFFLLNFFVFSILLYLK